MIWNAYFTGILCWLEKGLNLAIRQFQQLIILQVGECNCRRKDNKL